MRSDVIMREMEEMRKEEKDSWRYRPKGAEIRVNENAFMASMAFINDLNKQREILADTRIFRNVGNHKGKEQPG